MEKNQTSISDPTFVWKSPIVVYESNAFCGEHVTVVYVHVESLEYWT